MRKEFFVIALMLVGAMSGVSFGADDAMQGVCNALDKVKNFTPPIVKGLAIILLIGGFVVGGGMFMNRKENLAGRAIMVAVAGIVFFSALWLLADPAGNIVASLKTAICGQ